MYKLNTKTGKNIVISTKKSEADVQYRLVKRIEKLGIRGLKIMQECSITVSKVEQDKYYNEKLNKRIDKSTRCLYKIDVLLKRGDDILFIEVKKGKTKNLKTRAFITSQVNKYKDLGYICLLCEGINDIKNVIPEIDLFFKRIKRGDKPKYRKKDKPKRVLAI